MRFRQIAREWDLRIKRAKTIEELFNEEWDDSGHLLNLDTYNSCIVGEAHKFSDHYSKKYIKSVNGFIPSISYCEKCDNFGYRFSESKSLDEVQQIKKEFVKHFNLVHVKGAE